MSRRTAIAKEQDRIGIDLRHLQLEPIRIKGGDSIDEFLKASRRWHAAGGGLSRTLAGGGGSPERPWCECCLTRMWTDERHGRSRAQTRRASAPFGTRHLERFQIYRGCQVGAEAGVLAPIL
jgi:hypothetical protein